LSYYWSLINEVFFGSPMPAAQKDFRIGGSVSSNGVFFGLKKANLVITCLALPVAHWQLFKTWRII